MEVEPTGAGRTSVIMPVRDGERFIAEAIRSVLPQLGREDEVVVVDDGSTDGTAAVVDGIGDARLRRLATPGRGVSAARNLGLATVRGEFVAFLDHDDLWPAGRHAMLLAALRREPGHAAAYGRVRVIYEADAAEQWVGTVDGRHLPEQMGSGLYRRAALERVGRFDETVHLGEDADFHQRLLESGATLHFEEGEALLYRRHGGNVTNDTAALRQSMFVVARLRLARRRTGPAGAGAPPP